jgi:flagellar protein FliL
MAKDKAKAKEKPQVDEEAAEGAEAAPAPKKKLSLKTLLMFVVAPAVVVIALGVGGYVFLFSGGGDEHADAHGEGGHGQPATSAVFYDLPEILVNLASTGSKPVYLKLGVSLELEGPETPHAIEPVMPRVLDNFQVYLRELRLEDLQGSAGLLRLKEELIRRVNLAVAPIVVKDVLFKDMIIQ